VLVLLCIISIASLTGSFYNYYDDIIKELDNISTFIDRYESNCIDIYIKSLKLNKDSRLSKYMDEPGGNIALLANNIPNNFHTINHLIIPRWWLIDTNDYVYDNAEKHHLSYSILKSTYKKNLGSIKKFIEHIDRIQYIVILEEVPSEGIFFNKGKSDYLKINFKEVRNISGKIKSVPNLIVKIDKSVQLVEMASNKFIKIWLKEQKENKATYFLIFNHAAEPVSFDDVMKLYIPVKSTNVEPWKIVDRLIHNKADGRLWEKNTFRNRFSNLIKIPALYDELAPDNLKLILEDKQCRGTKDIQMLGINFPSYDMARWIIIIICGIQVYLYMHLKNAVLFYLTKDKQQNMIPSIFCYFNSYLAKFITYFTVCALPFITVCIAGNRLLSYHDDVSIINFLFFPVICISFLISWRSSKQLEKWYLR